MDDIGEAPRPTWFAPLLAAVDEAFVETGRDTPGWPDPHPDREPREEEYSRVTDAGRYRILGARVDAWSRALSGSGLADTVAASDQPWVGGYHIGARHPVRRLAPRRPGGLSILFATTHVDGAPFGLEVGLGRGEELPVTLDLVPDCGCDACDSGSADLLEVVDGWVLTVARGGVVHARRGTHCATRTLDGWSATEVPDASWLDESARVPEGVERWVGAPWA